MGAIVGKSKHHNTPQARQQISNHDHGPSFEVNGTSSSNQKEGREASGPIPSHALALDKGDDLHDLEEGRASDKFLINNDVLQSSSTQQVSEIHVTSQLKEMVQQIEFGFKRRDDKYVEDVFNRYADTQKKRIMQDRIGIALGEICSSPSDPLESPDGLDLVEFFRVVRRCCTLILVKLLLTDGLIFHCLSINVSDALIACRATELEQWAASLPLAQLVADALPRPAQGQSIQEPARFVAELTDEQVCGLRREEAL